MLLSDCNTLGSPHGGAKREEKLFSHNPGTYCSQQQEPQKCIVHSKAPHSATYSRPDPFEVDSRVRGNPPVVLTRFTRVLSLIVGAKAEQISESRELDSLRKSLMLERYSSSRSYRTLFHSLGISSTGSR